MKVLSLNTKNLIFGGKELGLSTTPPIPPTPSLPPYTIRMKFTEGVTPSFSKGTSSQVTASPNVWDLTYENSDWSQLLRGQSNLIEVIDANIAGVTNLQYMLRGCTALTTVSSVYASGATNLVSMFEGCTALSSVPLFDISEATSVYAMFYNCRSITSIPLFNTSKVANMNQMFYGCSSLSSVPLFDTSEVTNMNSMFRNCSSLTEVPLFDTSKVTQMNTMFQNCYNVQSGALALYQQASTQATPPTYHTNTFQYCGRDTIAGSAELAQIPTNWGGTA